ncbi:MULTISPECIES: GNAT family N-acetyltransferase [Paraburkholderia]|uniref:GNAT family N-acetyltransferase n=1 Tax=Paraburkholderia TaxID=1822464 RepID=UPI00225B437A|nr:MULTISPECIES: GNAT family N-acetyltransferase [Paraburkholderia]MCX4163494.1 GNAT family N-acetyltransferase [Paraburkholderia megapolitana]MDN7158989.1 GNAT family N-acetyltransferase [Paraburkholderia sp. CHISQ3]MDQ6496036.1 GNAT family N-acetyltransferase [Paraburkholderia megapolitana]
MNHSIQAELDRPIWAALTTNQAHLGYGDALARRYHPDVAPFAAPASETPDAYEALRQLLLPQEQAALLHSAEPIDAIDGLQITPVGVIHQMIASHGEATHADNGDVIRLGNADAKDMLDLTQKTKPGPFGKRTHEMGNYIGIRDHGRLIAMAGERMHIAGYVEISAVCVDDDYRGRGLAGRLMNVLRSEIEQRGETPFLHVFSHNASAIGLYERLGFSLRRTFHLTRVGHAGPR